MKNTERTSKYSRGWVISEDEAFF